MRTHLDCRLTLSRHAPPRQPSRLPEKALYVRAGAGSATSALAYLLALLTYGSWIDYEEACPIAVAEGCSSRAVNRMGGGGEYVAPHEYTLLPATPPTSPNKTSWAHLGCVRTSTVHADPPGPPTASGTPPCPRPGARDRTSMQTRARSLPQELSCLATATAPC